MRNMICSYCAIELKSRDIESHMEFCASRRERCKGCTKHVQKQFLQFHYENDHKYMTPDEKGDADGSEGEDGEECPVCLGPITLPIALECGHVFCMVCVKGIASTTKNCAICRRDINRDMLMDIRFCREEDVIKNYVKNSKCKKFYRSKSVPSRSPEVTSQVATRTQDYDSMVSALLSNRSSSNSYRYDRPTNTHTPPTYTPYCYSTSSFTVAQPSTSITSSRSTLVSSYRKHDTNYNPMAEARHEYNGRNSSVRHTMYESEEASFNPSSGIATTFSTSAGLPFEARPRRPTSLALSSSSQEDSGTTNTELPQLTQEEYDRWLAFQLSQCEDDIPPEEFNRRHRNPMVRSISMPEGKNSMPTYRTRAGESSGQDSSFENSPDAPKDSATSSPIKSPTSGENDSENSPSDSRASGNTPAINTGARPKCSTNLRKRVSFREEAPPKRIAPVMLPCEFCNDMFSERDLMRHQTSCDFNETKNPREYLLSRRSSVASSLSSPASPASPISPMVISPSASPSTSSLPPIPNGVHQERVPKSINVPHIPSMSPLAVPKSKVIYNAEIESQSALSNKPRLTDIIQNKLTKNTGLNPDSGLSPSSGICSATCSFSSSVSTTPSTSTSASPIPASTTPDTPTDVELEDTNATIGKPRRGRFLKSAISSWRSISGSRSRGKTKYLPSNITRFSVVTDSNENISMSNELPSSSTTVVPPTNENSGSDESSFIEKPTDQQLSDSFIKNRKSYKAPLPPPVRLVNGKHENSSAISNGQPGDYNDTSREESHGIRFDSMPMMNGQLQVKEDFYFCENCQQPFTLRKLKCHQTVCKKDEGTVKYDRWEVAIPTSNQIAASPRTNDIPALPNDNTVDTIPAANVNDSLYHVRYRKGPAPQPPNEGNVEQEEKIIFSYRSNSDRRSSDILNYSNGSRTEGRPHFKESTRLSRAFQASTFSTSRNWTSREVLYGGRTVEGSGGYSGNDSISSSTTSLNSLPGTNISTSNISLAEDRLRSSRAATSLGLSGAPVLLGTARYRERSLSRSRPSSLYSSRNACNIAAEAFTTAETQQFVKIKKKYRAPEPPKRTIT